MIGKKKKVPDIKGKYSEFKKEKGFETITKENIDALAGISHAIQSQGHPSQRYYDRYLKSLEDKFSVSDGISDGSIPQMSLPFEIDVPFPPPKDPKFTFIDLFSGIGGFRIAMQEVGGKCVFSSEWDHYARLTYEANFGEVPFGDICNYTKDESLMSTIPEHDILCAGFPCQPFSQAGLQKGFEDTRGTMFFEIMKIVKAKKPKVLFLENVKRFKTHDQGRTFATISRVLEKEGYKLYSKIIRAYDFGVPQNRERIFMVAFRENVKFEFPVPPEKRIYNNVGGILEKNPDRKYTISDKLFEGHKRRLDEHRIKGNGFGFSMFNEKSLYTNTLSARYYKDGSEIMIEQKGKNPRKLTPRECARLQGYPEKFKIVVSDVQAYKQFGNSVAVPAVTAISKNIVEALSASKNFKQKAVNE
jgi:DNA (cytosine-5)-methyltransferase 1